MLTTMNPYSFVEQDFIWVGEYIDGTCLPEYDFETKKRQDFYALQRNKLVRFGLVGHGMKLYYEVGGGFFKLNGQVYELVYRSDGKEYYLTGQFVPYNDVITYKDAEAWANLSRSDEMKFPSRITAYNFGYKVKLQVDGVKFNFKPIVSIPYNKPAYFDITLVADRDLDGFLVIKKNGTEIAEFRAPLRAGVGGRLKWNIRW